MFGKRVKERRLFLGITQEELALKLGYKTKSSINKIEMGVQTVPLDKVPPFADALNTTPEYLMGWSEDSIDYSDIFKKVTKKKIPVLGKIACGKPIIASETDAYTVEGEEINADFALIAKGDSMINARIYDGDIVFIRSQSEVNNGEIAVVMIGEEATLKRVYHDPQHQAMTLVAENPVYAPIVLTGSDLEQVKILGKAICFQSDIK